MTLPAIPAPQADAARIVAVIPAGTTLTATGEVMRGMGSAYPETGLTLRNDSTGSMVVVYDPTAATSADRSARGAARGAAPAPDTLTTSIGLGDAEEVMRIVLGADDDDQARGLQAMCGWMKALLDQHQAANYLTQQFTDSHGNSYALTVQRVDGQSPGERIAALQAQVADLQHQIAELPTTEQEPADEQR